MCGIVGFTGKKNIHQLGKLLTVIEHRGRDGRTVYYRDSVHLGMNRLAIIDLRHNLYPMKYKHYVLVFNGEIYNYRELKVLLQAKGVLFRTTSDAEVILPLYHLYGVKAFTMLEGMFAICIYDTQKKQMLLIRDKSGEKPLYYMHIPSGIAFASEVKALLSFDSNTKSLNKRAIRQYLTQGFVSAPDTLVSGIKKVPPSHYMYYDLATKSCHTHGYWDPMHQSLSRDAHDEAASVNTLESLLSRSVALRLVADVPVGCFLSGGVDSSLVTLFASQHKKHIQTYSVSFPGHHGYDESRFASYVANKLQTRHTVVECTVERVADLLDRIGFLVDEPIIDPAVIPTVLMANEARKHVKVVLTGEGADELFGGYGRYQKQLAVETFRRAWRVFPSFLQAFQVLPVRRLRGVSKPLSDRYSAQLVWNSDDLSRLLITNKEPLRQHDYLKRYEKDNPLLSMQLADYRGYMAEQLLMKIDKSTMAGNLEARAPYLDTNVISFAFQLPTSQKVRFFQGKYLLKKVAERYFPKSFVWRQKHGFDIPLRDWFRHELRSCVDQSAEYLESHRKQFDVAYYRRIVSEHMNKTHDHSGKIWSIVVLTRWMKAHHIAVI